MVSFTLAKVHQEFTWGGTGMHTPPLFTANYIPAFLMVHGSLGHPTGSLYDHTGFDNVTFLTNW